MIDNQLPWTMARAAGLLAYLLTTASVAFGLVLHHRWRSASWPRFVTNEVHRTVSLLALLAVAGHGLALLLDPYLAPTLSELLVPLTISYRPLWVAVGIIGAYLLLGLWLSQYLRSWLGYRAWARLHLLTYAAWVLALVHGLGAGSDTGTPWALAAYGGSVALVGGLVVARILDTEPEAVRFFGFGLVALVFTVVATWAIDGPLSPGWSARAGSTLARGQAALTATSTSGAGGPAASPGPASSTAQAFRASFDGTIGVERTAGGRVLVIDGRFVGPPDGSLQILLASTRDPAAASRLVLDIPTVGTCDGRVTALGETSLVGSCQYGDGTAVGVRLSITALTERRLTASLAVGPLGTQGGGSSGGSGDEGPGDEGPGDESELSDPS
ncbi:MAG TPA: ferric reductase-like transmembrane domain-containing protein [Candidatus Binatia bacterium]|nr:ferric reductase-like transmembrane domain-containing protein [Candidatus Binatia bacterium]